MRRRLALLLAVGACVCGAWPAKAHVGGSTGYAAIVVSDNVVRYALTVVPSTLPGAVAEELVSAGGGRAESRERVLGYLRRKLAVAAQGQPCELAGGFVESARPGLDTVMAVGDFVCPQRVQELAVRDDLFDVFGPDHHTLAKVEAGGLTQQFAFATEAREARFLVARVGGSSREGFFRLGMAHILTGYDHLLFLTALLVPGGSLWALLKIVTAFTIAHSITLTLAVLGMLTISPRLVEPAIAASIAWVALENLRSDPAPSHRWLVSFGFGLMHGLGFASGLGPLELPPGSLVLALGGFNLGVEVGQGLVVAGALPALLWLRSRAWEPQLVRVVSVALAAVGVGWLIERLFSA